MKYNNTKNLLRFHIIGISYKKSDAAIRGVYTINPSQHLAILSKAKNSPISDVMIVSTCNRTEIYGFAPSAEYLINLLLEETGSDKTCFTNNCYCKSGWDAVEHLFAVAAGLDSQLLGDYEIVGQIKAAFKLAKEFQTLDSAMERLVNTVLQCSKKIRTQTELSSGTVSVSFAAVQYVKENIPDYCSKKILLLGTGKLGRNTSKNIVDYLECKNVTLINRSPEKAVGLSKELGLQYAPIENLEEEIRTAEIILVAANATAPLITCAQTPEHYGKKYIIDLSIPHNVEPCVAGLQHIQLVSVDELSKVKDITLEKRKSEIPKVQSIIRDHVKEFRHWYDMREHLQVLSTVRNRLTGINADPLFLPLYKYKTTVSDNKEKIQRVLNGMASKMRKANKQGCYYIEAINEFISSDMH